MNCPAFFVAAVAMLCGGFSVALAERHIYVADHSIKKVLKIADDGKVL